MADLGGITLGKWEKILVDHFLIRHPSADIEDVYALEITGQTLAEACDLPQERAPDVIAAFRKAMKSSNGLRKALREGKHLDGNSALPGCFLYLALTLLVDSDLDGDYVDGNFRHKLARWLDEDKGFGTLSGVNRMWKGLSDWLDLKIQQGAPYRRLRLPVIPDAWRQIGYTRYLSFPAKRDLTFLGRFFSGHSEALDSARNLIDELAPLLKKAKISAGLELAFNEFHRLFDQSNVRMLGTHRFWILCERVLQSLQPRRVENAQIEMAIDDGCMIFLPAFGATESELAFSSLSEVVALPEIMDSPNLGLGIRRGLLFFRNFGTASWLAEVDIANCRGRVYVAVRNDRKHLLGQKLGRLIASGQWWITGDNTSVGKAEDALEGFRRTIDLSDHIYSARLVDGVRTKGVWLGRPGFLPYVESDFDQYKVHTEDGNAWDIHVENGRLKSVKDVDGTFSLEPIGPAGVDLSALRVPARFSRDAFIHDSNVGRRSQLEPLDDWMPGSKGPPPQPDISIGTWNEEPAETSNLLEAMYATGEYGWEEAKLIDLLRRVVSESGSWHVLRCLADAGKIEPRLRKGWKGRVWTLKPPTLIPLADATKDYIVVEGGICLRLEQRFCAVVKANGGTAFKSSTDLKWAPSVLGCTGVDLEMLVSILGWNVEQPRVLSQKPLHLCQTRKGATNYEIASTWAWDLKRFSRSGGSQGDVSLARLKHPGGIDHDIYRVTAKSQVTHFLSRTAAIVFAHFSAAEPMFAWQEGWLKRVIGEGGLPDALAAFARQQSLQCAGYRSDEYWVPASRETALALAKLIPNCISGLTSDSDRATTRLPLHNLPNRRMAGGGRPLWVGGELVAIAGRFST